MTDQELDRMLRRALLDAADQEAQTPPETEVPLSEGHRRRMREMLRDPLLWFRLRNPYPWRTVARRAAVVLLIIARRVEFRYHGDGPAQALPQYRIAALPEGYTETERAEADWNVRVTYECTGKQWIRFSYLYMQDGTASSVGIAESDTVKDITVSGMSGKLILTQSPESASVIIWFDTAQNLMFSIHANVDESVIIAMAESVSLCNSTN